MKRVVNLVGVYWGAENREIGEWQGYEHGDRPDPGQAEEILSDRGHAVGGFTHTDVEKAAPYRTKE